MECITTTELRIEHLVPSNLEMSMKDKNRHGMTGEQGGAWKIWIGVTATRSMAS